MRRIGFFIAVALVWGFTSLAQQTDEPLVEADVVIEGEDQAPAPEDDEGNGFLLNFIERTLSAPGREVQIRGISGILSSQATIDEIAVSDAEGVWLRIENVAIDWSRRALFFRRLDVSLLSIGAIDYIRPPLPPERPGPRLADAEARPFALPELPLQVLLGRLEIGRLTFGEAVLGEAAELTVAGSLTLVAGELETDLAIRRLDDPGGELALQAAFSNVTRELAVDLALSEPQGGVVATALNIEGRPAIELRLAGAGPLEDVDLDFSLDADAVRLAAGQVSLRDDPEGLAFRADFAGELAPLVPPAYRDFFAGQTAVRLAGVTKDAGGLRIDALALEGPALDLAGDLELGADNFPISLNLSGAIGDPRGPALTLPVPGGRTSVHSGVIEVRYGEGSRWQGLFALDRLAVGDIEIEDLTLSMGGRAENLEDPATRDVTIFAEGLATGIWAEDPDVRRALGERIDFFADIALPPQAPVEFRQVQMTGDALSLLTSGRLDDLVYSGRHVARMADISPLSGLLERELAGGIDIRASGDIFLAIGGFDLSFEGTARDLRLDEARLDPLLAGETALAGRVRRDETGLRAEGLRLANPQIEIATAGVISGLEVDVGFDARLSDLALVVEGVAGAATAQGRARGLAAGPINVALEAAIAEGAVAERPLRDARVAFDGAVLRGNVTGSVSGSGRLNGSAIALEGDLGLVGTSRSLRGFRFAVGPNLITGDIVQRGEAPIEGRLEIAAPDLAPLAALALTEAEGAANAVVELGPAAIGQGARIEAEIRNLAAAGVAIGALDLEAVIEDAFGVPLATASLAAEDVAAAGLAIERLDLRAEQRTATLMDFTATSRLAIGTEAELAGTLERLAEGFALGLERLALEQNGISARLLEPATVRVEGETVTLTPLALALGEGRIEAVGSIAEAFDLTLTLDAVPLAVANAIQPELGLAGTLDGSARVTGPRAAPAIDFDLTAAEVGAAVLEAAGLPLMSLEASGRTEADVLDFDARLFSPAGIEALARGRLPLRDGEMEIDLDLRAFPLELVDPVTGRQGLQGTLSGTARLAGRPAAPEASFALTGSGISARILRENLVPPLAVAAQGRFAEGSVTLAEASVSGAGGIALSASGTVPLEGPGLGVAVSGSLPLSLANAALADRAAALAGELALDVTVSGSLADPRFAGPLRVSGGSFIDPQTNIRLDNIGIDAALDGRTLAINALSARSAAGGGIAGAGRIVLDPAQNLPLELELALQRLGYTDGAFLSTLLDGSLRLTGALTGELLVAGTIDLDVTEISVAEGLGANAAAALEAVSHRNPPRPVLRTLERARVQELAERAEGRANVFVDILLRAPNQIFIRGRGLDVEMGGELRVRGPTTDLEPVGEFSLRRGRLNILGQRIDFDEGSLRLVGNLDPVINFEARTVTGEATAIVTVEGRVSAPEITFSSIPELPEDEVLALVIFNRTAQQLSPFQIAQLAAAAAELAGAGGNGLLAQFRGAIGLDDLDIVPDENGGAAVRAGRYIDENLYLDVQTGTRGDTRVSINLDITEQVRASGSVDTDGNSTIGIYYTRDY